MRGRRVRLHRGSLVVSQRLGPVVVARDRQLVSSSCLCAQHKTAGVSGDFTLRGRRDPSRNACPFIWLHVGRLTGRGRQSPPTAHSRQRRIPSSAAIWMLDPSALAPAKVAQTLLLLVRSLGAYDVTPPRGRGSEEFGPLETIPHQQRTDPPSSPRKPQPRHDATLDQIPLAGIWSRTIARVGLK